MFNLKNNFNDKSVIKKFEKEFPVFGYEDKNQIDDILSKNKCDAFLMSFSSLEMITEMPSLLIEL
jgi:hypothetical protein